MISPTTGSAERVDLDVSFDVPMPTLPSDP